MLRRLSRCINDKSTRRGGEGGREGREGGGVCG